MNDYNARSDFTLRRRALHLWANTPNARKWLRAVTWLDTRRMWIEHGGRARCVIGAKL